jgi:hypothetical protein
MSLIQLLAAGHSVRSTKDVPNRYRVTSRNLLPKFGLEKNPFAPAPKVEPLPAAALASAEPTAIALVPAAPAPLETADLFAAAAHDAIEIPAPVVEPLPAAVINPTAEPPPSIATEPVPEPVVVAAAAPTLTLACDDVVAKITPQKIDAPAPAPVVRESLKSAAGTPACAAKPAVQPARAPLKLNPFKWFASSSHTTRKPKGSAAPKQGELSLENLKVKRNDLTETDLEIVPAQPAKAGVAAPRKPAGDDNETGGPAEETGWRGLTSRVMKAAHLQNH